MLPTVNGFTVANRLCSHSTVKQASSHHVQGAHACWLSSIPDVMLQLAHQGAQGLM